MDMNRKDEIIRLQNDLMQDMLRRQFKSITDDLWGKMPQDTPEKTGAGAASGAIRKTAVEAEQPAQENEPAEAPEKLEDLLAELNGYIGLDTVKAEVNSLVNWIQVCKARGESGLPTPALSLHMVFSGNPGTGKTMIARLMARIYKTLGVLSKGQLVEVDRSGLVAGYVGQTAGKTREVIEKALGGVLFIDEAYALVGKGENDYGQEAVDTLLKAMEDNRDDLVVIVAGYTELMTGFVHSNPGLESRFNRFIHFPDYTVDEMLAIFRMRCEKSGYALDDGAQDALRDILTRKSADVRGFGNARGVRNLFETAIARQADRLAAEKGALDRERLMRITREDLRKASGVAEDGDTE